MERADRELTAQEREEIVQMAKRFFEELREDQVEDQLSEEELPA